MSDVRYWIGFNRIPGIGPSRLAALREYFGELEAAWHASAASLRAVGLPHDALERLLYFRQRMDLAKELDRVEALGARVLTWESDDYPTLLRQIDSPPPVLYVRGELLPTDEWAVGVVGTRHATVYGKDVARRISAALAENGVTVVSGLALGVDGIAHRAALDAGGRTIAVLATGVDSIYPTRHASLGMDITASGALVSDYPLDTRPDPGNFPPRNRLISGLSRGTLAVEAGERSGALITIHYALEQGRETFAIPGNIHSKASAGTNTLIQRGEAKLVTCLADILDELHMNMVAEQREIRQAVPENDAERALFPYLSIEPLHIDELVRTSGLPTATVSSTLAMLELKGVVRRTDQMAYVLAH